MAKPRHLNGTGKGKFIYDYKYDILTIRIKNRVYKKSVELENFVADIDEKGFVTGLRVFDASTVFRIKKYVLRNLVHFDFKARIENNIITITIKFIARIRNKIIPIIGENQSVTQQITTPADPYKLKDSSVACAMEA